jgi:hypothetical protein
VDYKIPASEHPLATRIPKPSNKPAVVGDPDVFSELMRPPKSPTKLADYTTSDIPQLGLHIVSFTDKTLVTLYWPHTLMDAMGKSAVLEAWGLILQGREEEVKVPIGAIEDPLEELGRYPTEAHKLEHRRLGIWALMSWGMGQLPSLWRKLETRMVCVPSSFLDKLRQEAIDELASTQKTANGERQEEGKPFLSEGDVLCAWFTRLATAHLPHNSSQTIVLNNAFDIRKRLSTPSSAPYISNAVSFIPVLLSLGDIREKSLWYTASQIRKAIQELGSREQVETYQALVRNSRGKMPPFFGNANMHMITYSNWSKAKLFDVDFSAAIIGEEGKKRGVAKPVYMQNNQFGLTLPSGFPVLGKDNEGNYWVSGYMSEGVWKGIEKMLEGEAVGGGWCPGEMGSDGIWKEGN